MLLFLVIAVLLLNRRRWYGYCYQPYWGYPQFRGCGPYAPNYYGYIWNGYAWQPRYAAGPYRAAYGDPYSYYHRTHWW